MLTLKDIKKDYRAGDSVVSALKGVSIDFRPHEFVSILGPSGCGKTTLLNIIGGLDGYTSGDLVISGVSTKKYKDADWDAYRNHSIGFVFQSYNLIPHQSVLANVELALTLSGVSKAERRRRATEALQKVGLGDQLKKRPNQMSGGQMQRVAIARALVNDPDIVLADEPTGALDSATSVQIMEILKSISNDKLIIMVTHNPELAQAYSSRIIRLLDGRVVDDSNPYDQETDEIAEMALSGKLDTTETVYYENLKKAPEEKKNPKEKKKKQKRTSMSLFTAMSLSMNNLMTKRGRTLLTSFAGSIGIIGIALILSVSTGVQAYINRVQEDTLSSYPITLQAESVDMSGLITTLMDASSGSSDDGEGEDGHEDGRIYTSSIMYDLMNSLNTAETTKNNLKAFRTYMENSEAFSDALSSVQYEYDVDMNIYTEDVDGNIISCDAEDMMTAIYGSAMSEMTSSSVSSTYMSSSFSQMEVWQEMLSGDDGELVSDLFSKQYELLYGHWPEKYNEVVLFVTDDCEVSDFTLYTLGLKSGDTLRQTVIAAMSGEELDTDSLESWSYDEICGKEFRLILSADRYRKNADGTYTDLTESDSGTALLYNSDGAVTLQIVGIVRPSDEAVSSMISTGVGYTSALKDYVIEAAQETDLVKEQLANPDTDVLTGLPFPNENGEELSNAEKAEKIKDYFSTLSSAEKAVIYTEIASVPADDYLDAMTEQYMATMDRATIEQTMAAAYAQQMGTDDTQSISDYIAGMDDETLFSYMREMVRENLIAQYAQGVEEQLGALPADQVAAMLDSGEYTEEQYAQFYDTYMPSEVSDSDYDTNLKKIGYVDPDSPTAIYLYASTFSDKDTISDLIEEYNNSVEEDDQIRYTDYVALMMSSITTVINAISYVLIAFVAISLVVSSIMIGIITYISVLERTKEIGILRAIGASKRDVSRVFNAETLIVGFTAGAIGIGVTLLLIIPINLIVHSLTGIMILNAQLPPAAAVILVGISMFLTFIAGLVPAKFAAKKDPVIALRSE